MLIHGQAVHGVEVDARTGCAHYRSPLDVIAIRFACCETYHPCYLCHEAVADHPAQRWPADSADRKVILCGICGGELSLLEYLAAESTCPACGAAFNPGCTAHLPLYFDPA